MKCPYCTGTELRVVDKRNTSDDEATRRRRECLSCNKRFTTYERIENVELMITKKDGTRENFDRNKVMNGILKCCAKRPVEQEKIQKIVHEIENELRSKDITEITGKMIGDLVVKKLKRLDKVAYIRFASVYKEFADLDEFQKELEKLLKGKRS